MSILDLSLRLAVVVDDVVVGTSPLVCVTQQACQNGFYSFSIVCTCIWLKYFQEAFLFFSFRKTNSLAITKNKERGEERKRERK